MKNVQWLNQSRRQKAYVSILGTTQLHLRNPYIVAWWSAAFPGFGHLLLSKYLRGFALFIWEFVINTQSHLNQAIVYSFTGKFDKAKEVIDHRWLLLYIPVYVFAIWDSYRTTIDTNKIYLAANREDADFQSFVIHPLEINYLDKRNPRIAVFWTLFMPGLGQLYIHRIGVSFFLLIWWIALVYLSHFLEAVHLLVSGDIGKSTAILSKEWFLFMPSVYGFAIYDAYVNTVENNKLFEDEQRHFLQKNFQHPSFKMPAARRE
ncbi:hypothetical protein [Fictibacillus gelatini]|uniref:hypothetical protein n=1 Tax=Fictibacillus gelatini TaxID=225985 RepID=UPI0003F71400|nr:hypothetical protein [Fictibacillus gelatini]